MRIFWRHWRWALKSAVGSTYNYAAPLYNRMIDAFRAGDMAQALACSNKVVAMVELVIKYGVLPAGKAMMSLVGVECGSPRAPVPSLSADSRKELFRSIEKLEVL